MNTLKTTRDGIPAVELGSGVAVLMIIAWKTRERERERGET